MGSFDRAKNMNFSEKLCLKWNDFSVNLPSVFSELRHVCDFSDVTLACEDGRMEAHRLVLSSASPVFRRILQPTLHPHPLVYMRGLKVATLEAVLDFIYSGEANILEGNWRHSSQLLESCSSRGWMVLNLRPRR